MKKLLVIVFLICIALGEWQQSDEIALPKGIQVNDLTINSSGELWILSTSSILKFETASRDLLTIQEFKGGKRLVVPGEKAYVVDNGNQLFTLELSTEGSIEPTNLVFKSPGQIGSATADNKPYFIIQEPHHLAFLNINDETQTALVSTSVERFSTIPLADYGDKQTPLYTLANNRVYSWTGGTFDNPESYQKNIIYSASNRILDLCADRKGNLFVLFTDSIVVLEPDGDYKTKVEIDKLPLKSEILTNPANNNIVIFDQFHKSLKILSGVSKSASEDIIILNSNRPNPVDNYTEIEFTINQSLDLTITIYNLIGEPVKVIARGRYLKGLHRAIWRADDERGNLVPNGIYFYRLESKKGVAIRQLIVLR